MNYRHILVFTASLAVVTGCEQPQSTSNAGTMAGTPAVTAADSTSPVIATVNGSPITEGALEVYTKQRKPAPGNQNNNSREAILDELVSLELMRQEGVSKGLGSQPVIIATMDQQQRTVLAGAAIQDYIKNNPVPNEEIQATYDKEIGMAGSEFNARHILLKTEEAAAEVIKLLDSGSDFSELAKEKSTGPSGSSGGELGWFGAGQMVKPFAEATAALEKGSYTSAPVQTQFGWHVILLDDTRESTPPPFDDVKARIKMFLVNQKLSQHIKDVKSAATIDVAATNDVKE